MDAIERISSNNRARKIFGVIQKWDTTLPENFKWSHLLNGFRVAVLGKKFLAVINPENVVCFAESESIRNEIQAWLNKL